MKRLGSLCLCVVFFAGCGGGTKSSGTTVWAAPPSPMERARLAGLTPETHEFVSLHVHAHLDIFLNGDRVTVPAGIGIEIDDPAVKSGKAPDGSTGYGGINPPCAQPCISPLHTHQTDGVLHTEAKKNRFNTLGEFFTEWSVRLDKKCVGDYCRPGTSVEIYVNGENHAGDPRQIQLTNQKEIAIVIGKPPDEIPSTYPR
jgi:hypothetical protein